MSLLSLFKGRKRFDSSSYWEKRYARGRNSGAGSYGNLAEFKARVINEFIEKNKIKTTLNMVAVMAIS